MAKKNFLQGFASEFWVANVLELFERLAFYGMKAVLVVFLIEKVGLTEDAGKLAGWFSTVIFLLPIFGGVLVDKYGFRKMLILCFTIFGIGYFLIALAGMSYSKPITDVIGTWNYTFIVLMLTAAGGSLIKPCIVGTVAKTTSPDVRSMGFSIYYTLVNLGGTLGPIVALLVRKNLGIEFVLIASSITSILLILGTWIFFREPVGSGETTEVRTFKKVFTDMVLVFGNIRFITFLVIFSGFWIMFWQIFFLLPVYAKSNLGLEDFELIETIDAAWIILFTIPVTALVRKWKSVTAITVGFVLASASWIVIGLNGSLIFTIIGVSIFALGEAMQSPRFYEYVSNLAPSDQVGTYMGFSFLPVAIGSFAAGYTADYLRLTYLNSNPQQMWFILAAIGFACTFMLILYNQFLAPKQN